MDKFHVGDKVQLIRIDASNKNILARHLARNDMLLRTGIVQRESDEDGEYVVQFENLKDPCQYICTEQRCYIPEEWLELVEKKKYFTGAVVCVKDLNEFIKGFVYHIENGVLYGNGSSNNPVFDKIESIEDLNYKCGYIPIKDLCFSRREDHFIAFCGIR